MAQLSTKQDQLREAALRMHEEHQGKLAVAGKVAIRGQEDLSLAYSPGVAEPCLAIADKPEDVYRYTAKGNLVAVVSDGSAVLGLGNIGGMAGLPVMEGKSLLFKAFAGVDSFPLVLSSQEVEQIVATVQNVAPTFGGINLEDISAPRCFEVEERLRQTVDIPVFHDDQHGTAIVVAAGLLNALKLTGKRIEEIRVVVEGAGAGGIAVSNLLLDFGVRDLTIVDTKGAIYAGRTAGMNRYKEEIAQRTNPRRIQGHLADALKDADVFVGLSVGGTTTKEMVATMRPSPIIFACSNPVPEIWPADAIAGGAAVVGTGRSDYPNQLNNVLAFPGVFRGALDVRATSINEAMKRAAAVAIANLVSADELQAEYIIPGPFDRRVAPAVAAAVAAAAVETGVARNPMAPEAVAEHCRQLVEQQG
ncbi:MAG: malate dehydrogenase [Symbiobacteriaceae bacterium]|nr:malate dehydrogenase [Symbiobacteriaceae bacterium]